MTELKKEIEDLKAENKALKNQIKLLQLALFGRRSEKRLPENPLQLTIQFDATDALPEEQNIEPVIREIEIESHKRRTGASKRKTSEPNLPDSLKRIDIILEPQGIDYSDTSKYEKIGEDVREVLEVKASAFYVNRYIRPIYRLIQEESDVQTSIYQHPPKESFIPKSYAGNSVLSELIIGKYMDHLPVYRQHQIFKRHGVNIPYSTINSWVHQVASVLYPLYELQVKEILKSSYIQVDETILPVVHQEKSKSIKAYIWLIHDVNARQVFFHYDKGSRAQSVIISLLKDYSGYIQSDGYSAYEIYERKKGVQLIGCWVHARRKFVNALNEDKDLAGKALEYIGLLYQIEESLKSKNLNIEQIAMERKRLAYPIIRNFENWMRSLAMRVTPKSLMGKAISYTNDRLERLSRYVSDGTLLLDNNLIENQVRPLALGRKNYMFCDNNDTARNAALYYTFFGTCKLQNINPCEWFIDVLDKIKDTKLDDLSKLLPINWKK